MTRIALLSLSLLLMPGLLPGVVSAQDHDHPGPAHGPHATADGLPDGWLMRLDRESFTPDMVDFQIMDPGWHVKTGRAAGIFWRPEMVADGEFSARAVYHLFSPASHAEAFGLFVGGRDLGDDGQQYLYFLVRQTGEYLIKRRTGSETSDIIGWTRHPAIPMAPPGELGPTAYEMAIAVGAGDVTFMVNGRSIPWRPGSTSTLRAPHQPHARPARCSR
jgi:hypothetical protein